MELDFKKVAIHGVPRSGTSWLGQIFNSHPKVAYRYQPLFSYTFKDYLNEQSSLKRINEFYIKIKNSSDPFLLQKGNSKLANYSLEFNKTEISHVVYKEVRYHHIVERLIKQDKNQIVIGLIRNPLAVINSWINTPKEFRKDLGWDELEEWRFAPKKNKNKKAEYYGFEKWKEVTELFHYLKDKYPSQFHLLTYNQLLKETMKAVKTLFSFCALSFNSQCEDFINKSKSMDDQDAYGVMKIKQKDDLWRTTLNKEIKDGIIQNLKNSDYEQYLKT